MDVLEKEEQSQALEILGDPTPPRPLPQRVGAADMEDAFLSADNALSLKALRTHLRQEVAGDAIRTIKSLLDSKDDRISLNAAEKLLHMAFGEDEIKGKNVHPPGGGIHFHLGGEKTQERVLSPGSQPPLVGKITPINEENSEQ